MILPRQELEPTQDSTEIILTSEAKDGLNDCKPRQEMKLRDTRQNTVHCIELIVLYESNREGLGLGLGVLYRSNREGSGFGLGLQCRLLHMTCQE